MSGHMRPFCKWVGSKTKLLPIITELMPSKIGNYFEPFLGGGAVFFHLASIGKLRDARSSLGRAVLGDANKELVNTYVVVRDKPREVADALRHFKLTYDTTDRASFYKRQQVKMNGGDGDAVERAARFVLITKLSFNGLWRVNGDGHHNAPWGEYTSPEIYSVANLEACSEALQGVSIGHHDFSATLAEDDEHYGPVAGDFVYCDPPYVPMTSTANFTAYTMTDFGIQAQTHLRDLARKLKEKGVHVMLSNHDTPLVRELYAAFSITGVDVHRGMAADASKRGSVGEVLIQ